MDIGLKVLFVFYSQSRTQILDDRACGPKGLKIKKKISSIDSRFGTLHWFCDKKIEIAKPIIYF